jgi:hypothetical protein
MHIHLLIGMLMVMPVMGCPPQRSLLNCRRSEPRQDELKNPARPIRPVCKIAVIASGNAEHTNDVQSHAQPKGFPRDSREESSQANQVNSEEWQALDPIDVTHIDYRLGFVRDGDSAHETPQNELAIKVTRMISEKARGRL